MANTDYKIKKYKIKSNTNHKLAYLRKTIQIITTLKRIRKINICIINIIPM